MKNSTQGFTLIELLIVIAIIGILAAVLIPNLLGARKRAYDTSAQSCAKSIQTAQATFQIDKRRYFEITKVEGAHSTASPTITFNDPAKPTTETALTTAEIEALINDLNTACFNADTVITEAAAAAGDIVTADIPAVNPSTTEYATQVVDQRGSQAYVVTANKMGNRSSTDAERGL